MARPPASADVFRAVADPTRRSIIELLARGERTAGSIAGAFELCQSTISEHLAILRRAGVVDADEMRGRRMYRLRTESLRHVIEWATPLLHHQP